MQVIRIQSLPPVGYVALGGCCGSVLRFLISDPLPVPAGTFLVNVTGCIAIDILMYHSIFTGAFSREARMFLGFGCIGSFTTFSAFATETITFSPVFGVINILANLLCGLLGIFIGRTIVLSHRRP